MSQPLAALVPVKRFAESKSRLDGALSPTDRAVLAEALATAVVKACDTIPVFVACEDDEVARWAMGCGAAVVRSAQSGLNRVVRHGVAELGVRGFERVLIAHADLADPRNLAGLAGWDGVVLVPDRRLDGTNVLIVPTDAGFCFSYGLGSFARHLSEAERIPHPFHIIDDAGLSLDLDEPDDLDAYSASTQHPTAPVSTER